MPASAVKSAITARAPRSRLVSAATAGTLAYAPGMRLATYLPPGGGAPLAGEVRGDEIVAFADGSTVLDRLASGDRAPAAGDSVALGQVELPAPLRRPRPILGSGPNSPAHPGATRRTLP